MTSLSRSEGIGLEEVGGVAFLLFLSMAVDAFTAQLGEGTGAASLEGDFKTRIFLKPCFFVSFFVLFCQVLQSIYWGLLVESNHQNKTKK